MRLDVRRLRYLSAWVRHTLRINGELVTMSKELTRLRDAPVAHFLVAARGVERVVEVACALQGAPAARACGLERLWLVCPGCGSRRRDLYLAPRAIHWKCRRCLGLVYDTDCLNRFERALHRRNKVEAQLAGCRPVASKKRTRLMETLLRCEMRIGDIVIALIDREMLANYRSDFLDDSLL